MVAIEPSTMVNISTFVPFLEEKIEPIERKMHICLFLNIAFCYTVVAQKRLYYKE